MKGNTMKKTIITVATTLAVLFVIGKDAQKQKEIDDLKARLERTGRFSDLYFNTLRKFNDEVDFIRITNHL
jgi:hypothetical protein